MNIKKRSSNNEGEEVKVRDDPWQNNPNVSGRASAPLFIKEKKGKDEKDSDQIFYIDLSDINERVSNISLSINEILRMPKDSDDEVYNDSVSDNSGSDDEFLHIDCENSSQYSVCQYNNNNGSEKLTSSLFHTPSEKERFRKNKEDQRKIDKKVKRELDAKEINELIQYLKDIFLQHKKKKVYYKKLSNSYDENKKNDDKKAFV
jgi:hypothetical protein